MSIIDVENAIAVTANKKEMIKFPKANISEINIEHNEGAFSGGTGTPTWATDGNANSLLAFLKLYLNSKLVQDWSGEAEAKAAGLGVQALRKFNQLSNGEVQPNEEYTIRDPFTIPNDVNVRLDLEYNTIANMQDADPGDHTGYGGTLDVSNKIVAKDGSPSIMKVFQSKMVIGSASKITKILCEEMDPNDQILGILIFADDDGTRLTVTEAKLINMTMMIDNIVVWQGNLYQLAKQTASKAKISLTELADAVSTDNCWAMIPLKGQKLGNSKRFKIDFNLTAQTALDLHYWVISEGKL